MAFNITCEEGDRIDLSVNIPDNFEDVRVFLQTQGKTSGVPVQEGYDPECQGMTSSAVRAQQIAQSRGEYYALREMPIIIKQEAAISPGTTALLENSGYEVDISQASGAANVTMSMPSGDVPYPANPSVRIIGTPLLISFDAPVSGRARITFPLAIPQFVDPASIGVYVLIGKSWRQVENVEFTKDKAIAVVDDISLFLVQAENGRYETMFALAGIYCATCFATRLEKVYDGGALDGKRTAVVLVHGITTDNLRWQFLVDDFAQTKQPFQVWMFSYPLTMQPREAAIELASQLEQHASEFDQLTFITHSMGGIEAQLALEYGAKNGYSFVQKTSRVVLAGQPGLGSPTGAVYGRLFAFLLNLRSTAMLFSQNAPMLLTAIEGMQVPRVPGINYYVIAGRQPYKFTLDLFMKNGEYEPNDGIITTLSARTVGDEEISDTCNNYFEVPMTHTDLVDAPLPRRIMGRIAAKDLAEAHPDMALIGYNKIVNFNAQCVTGTYIIAGKRISEAETEAPLLCNCGNGVCGEGENEVNCPSDCAVEVTYFYTCRVAPWILYPAAFILLITSAAYAAQATKRHKFGRGAKTLLAVTGVIAIAFVAMHAVCRIPPLIGYGILIFTGTILTLTHYHLKFYKKPLFLLSAIAILLFAAGLQFNAGMPGNQGQITGLITEEDIIENNIYVLTPESRSEIISTALAGSGVAMDLGVPLPSEQKTAGGFPLGVIDHVAHYNLDPRPIETLKLVIAGFDYDANSATVRIRNVGTGMYVFSNEVLRIKAGGNLWLDQIPYGYWLMPGEEGTFRFERTRTPEIATGAAREIVELPETSEETEEAQPRTEKPAVYTFPSPVHVHYGNLMLLTEVLLLGPGNDLPEIPPAPQVLALEGEVPGPAETAAKPDREVLDYILLPAEQAELDLVALGGGIRYDSKPGVLPTQDGGTPMVSRTDQRNNDFRRVLVENASDLRTKLIDAAQTLSGGGRNTTLAKEAVSEYIARQLEQAQERTAETLSIMPITGGVIFNLPKDKTLDIAGVRKALEIERGISQTNEQATRAIESYAARVMENPARIILNAETASQATALNPAQPAGCDLAVLYTLMPEQLLGGDLAITASLQNGKFLMLTADGSGEGATAAGLKAIIHDLVTKLIAGRVQNLSGQTILNPLQAQGILEYPGLMLEYINNNTQGLFAPRANVAVSAVVYSPDTGNVVFSSAGLPVYIVAGQTITEYKFSGTIGLNPNENYTVNETRLDIKHMLFLPSWGIREQLNKTAVAFIDSPEFNKTLYLMATYDSEEAAAKLQEALDTYRGKNTTDEQPQEDEYSAIILRRITYPGMMSAGLPRVPRVPEEEMPALPEAPPALLPEVPPEIPPGVPPGIPPGVVPITFTPPTPEIFGRTWNRVDYEETSENKGGQPAGGAPAEIIRSGMQETRFNTEYIAKQAEIVQPQGEWYLPPVQPGAPHGVWYTPMTGAAVSDITGMQAAEIMPAAEPTSTVSQLIETVAPAGASAATKAILVNNVLQQAGTQQDIESFLSTGLVQKAKAELIAELMAPIEGEKARQSLLDNAIQDPNAPTLGNQIIDAIVSMATSPPGSASTVKLFAETYNKELDKRLENLRWANGRGRRQSATGHDEYSENQAVAGKLLGATPGRLPAKKEAKPTPAPETQPASFSDTPQGKTQNAMNNLAVSGAIASADSLRLAGLEQEAQDYLQRLSEAGYVQPSGTPELSIAPATAYQTRLGIMPAEVGTEITAMISKPGSTPAEPAHQLPAPEGYSITDSGTPTADDRQALIDRMQAAGYSGALRQQALNLIDRKANAGITIDVIEVPEVQDFLKEQEFSRDFTKPAPRPELTARQKAIRALYVLETGQAFGEGYDTTELEEQFAQIDPALQKSILEKLKGMEVTPDGMPSCMKAGISWTAEELNAIKSINFPTELITRKPKPGERPQVPPDPAADLYGKLQAFFSQVVDEKTGQTLMDAIKNNMHSSEALQGIIKALKKHKSPLGDIDTSRLETLGNELEKLMQNNLETMTLLGNMIQAEAGSKLAQNSLSLYANREKIISEQGQAAYDALELRVNTAREYEMLKAQEAAAHEAFFSGKISAADYKNAIEARERLERQITIGADPGLKAKYDELKTLEQQEKELFDKGLISLEEFEKARNNRKAFEEQVSVNRNAIRNLYKGIPKMDWKELGKKANEMQEALAGNIAANEKDEKENPPKKDPKTGKYPPAKQAADKAKKAAEEAHKYSKQALQGNKAAIKNKLAAVASAQKEKEVADALKQCEEYNKKVEEFNAIIAAWMDEDVVCQYLICPRFSIGGGMITGRIVAPLKKLVAPITGRLATPLTGMQGLGIVTEQQLREAAGEGATGGGVPPMGEGGLEALGGGAPSGVVLSPEFFGLEAKYEKICKDDCMADCGWAEVGITTFEPSQTIPGLIIEKTTMVPGCWVREGKKCLAPMPFFEENKVKSLKDMLDKLAKEAAEAADTALAMKKAGLGAFGQTKDGSKQTTKYTIEGMTYIATTPPAQPPAITLPQNIPKLEQEDAQRRIEEARRAAQTIRAAIKSGGRHAMAKAAIEAINAFEAMKEGLSAETKAQLEAIKAQIAEAENELKDNAVRAQNFYLLVREGLEATGETDKFGRQVYTDVKGRRWVLADTNGDGIAEERVLEAAGLAPMPPKQFVPPARKPGETDKEYNARAAEEWVRTQMRLADWQEDLAKVRKDFPDAFQTLSGYTRDKFKDISQALARGITGLQSARQAAYTEAERLTIQQIKNNFLKTALKDGNYDLRFLGYDKAGKPVVEILRLDENGKPIGKVIMNSISHDWSAMQDYETGAKVFTDDQIYRGGIYTADEIFLDMDTTGFTAQDTEKLLNLPTGVYSFKTDAKGVIKDAKGNVVLGRAMLALTDANGNIIRDRAGRPIETDPNNPPPNAVPVEIIVPQHVQEAYAQANMLMQMYQNGEIDEQQLISNLKLLGDTFTKDISPERLAAMSTRTIETIGYGDMTPEGIQERFRLMQEMSGADLVREASTLVSQLAQAGTTDRRLLSLSDQLVTYDELEKHMNSVIEYIDLSQRLDDILSKAGVTAEEFSKLSQREQLELINGLASRADLPVEKLSMQERLEARKLLADIIQLQPRTATADSISQAIMDYNKAVLDDIRMRAQAGEDLTAEEFEVARSDLIRRLEDRFNSLQAEGDWADAYGIADRLTEEFASEAGNLGVDLAAWINSKKQMISGMDNILAVQKAAGTIAQQKEILRTRSPAAYARLLEIEQVEDPELRQQMIDEIYSTPAYYGMTDSDVSAFKAYLASQAMAIEDAKVATRDETKVSELKETATLFAKQYGIEKKFETLEPRRESLMERINSIENAIKADQALLRSKAITRDQFNIRLASNNAQLKALKNEISQVHKELLGNAFDKYISELSPDAIMFSGVQQRYNEYQSLVRQRAELSSALAGATTPETQQYIRDQISRLDNQISDVASAIMDSMPLTTGAGALAGMIQSQGILESALARAAGMNDLALATDEQLRAMVARNQEAIGRIKPQDVQKSLAIIESSKNDAERAAASRSISYQTDQISALVRDIEQLAQTRAARLAQGMDVSDIDEKLADLRNIASGAETILKEIATGHTADVSSRASRVLSDLRMLNDKQRISEINAESERMNIVSQRLKELRDQAQRTGTNVETIPEYQSLSQEYKNLVAGINARATELSNIRLLYEGRLQDINRQIEAAQRKLDNAILAQMQAREQGFGEEFGKFDIEQARAELGALKGQRDSMRSISLALTSEQDLGIAKEGKIREIMRLVDDYGTINARSENAWKTSDWLDKALQNKYGGNLELAKAGAQTYGEQIMDAVSEYIDLHSQELMRKNPGMSPADARARAVASAAGLVARLSSDANSNVLDTLKRYDIHEANTLENILSFGISKIAEDSRTTKYRANADLMAGVLENVRSMAAQTAELPGLSGTAQQQLREVFGQIAAVQKQHTEVKDWFARKDFEKRFGDTTGSAAIMIGSGAVGGFVGGAMQSLAEAYGASRWATTAISIISNGLAFHASNNIMTGDFSAQAWSPEAFAHSVAVIAGISGMNTLFRTATAAWSNKAAEMAESKILSVARQGKIMEGAIKANEFGLEVGAFSAMDAISRASAGRPIDWGDILLDQIVLLGSIKTGGALAKNVRETFIEENTWKWNGKSLEVARAGYEKRMRDLADTERQLVDTMREKGGLTNDQYIQALRDIQAERAMLGERLIKAEQRAIQNRLDNLLSGREWQSLPSEIRSQFPSEEAYRLQAYRELADQYARLSEGRSAMLEPLRSAELTNEIIRQDAAGTGEGFRITADFTIDELVTSARRVSPESLPRLSPELVVSRGRLTGEFGQLTIRGGTPGVPVTAIDAHTAAHEAISTAYLRARETQAARSYDQVRSGIETGRVSTNDVARETRDVRDVAGTRNNPPPATKVLSDVARENPDIAARMKRHATEVMTESARSRLKAKRLTTPELESVTDADIRMLIEVLEGKRDLVRQEITDRDIELLVQELDDVRGRTPEGEAIPVEELAGVVEKVVPKPAEVPVIRPPEAPLREIPAIKEAIDKIAKAKEAEGIPREVQRARILSAQEELASTVIKLAEEEGTRMRSTAGEKLRALDPATLEAARTELENYLKAVKNEALTKERAMIDESKLQNLRKVQEVLRDEASRLEELENILESERSMSAITEITIEGRPVETTARTALELKGLDFLRNALESAREAAPLPKPAEVPVAAPPAPAVVKMPAIVAREVARTAREIAQFTSKQTEAIRTNVAKEQATIDLIEKDKSAARENIINKEVINRVKAAVQKDQAFIDSLKGLSDQERADRIEKREKELRAASEASIRSVLDNELKNTESEFYKKVSERLAGVEENVLNRLVRERVDAQQRQNIKEQLLKDADIQEQTKGMTDEQKGKFIDEQAADFIEFSRIYPGVEQYVGRNVPRVLELDTLIKAEKDPAKREALQNERNSIVDRQVSEMMLKAEAKTIGSDSTKVGELASAGTNMPQYAHYGGDLRMMREIRASDGTKRLASFVGDAKGHGRQASIIKSIVADVLLKASDSEIENPERIAQKVTDVLLELNDAITIRKDRTMMTFSITVTDPATGKAKIITIGQPVVVVSADGTPSLIRTPGFAAGIIKTKVGKPQEIQLGKGDVILELTDGIAEQHRANVMYDQLIKAGEVNPDSNILKVVREAMSRGMTPEQIRDGVLEKLKDFRQDTPQEDDITLVVTRFGTAERPAALPALAAAIPAEALEARAKALAWISAAKPEDLARIRADIEKQVAEKIREEPGIEEADVIQLASQIADEFVNPGATAAKRTELMQDYDIKPEQIKIPEAPLREIPAIKEAIDKIAKAKEAEGIPREVQRARILSAQEELASTVIKLAEEEGTRMRSTAGEKLRALDPATLEAARTELENYLKAVKNEALTKERAMIDESKLQNLRKVQEVLRDEASRLEELENILESERSMSAITEITIEGRPVETTARTALELKGLDFLRNALESAREAAPLPKPAEVPAAKPEAIEKPAEPKPAETQELVLPPEIKPAEITHLLRAEDIPQDVSRKWVEENKEALIDEYTFDNLKISKDLSDETKQRLLGGRRTIGGYGEHVHFTTADRMASIAEKGLLGTSSVHDYGKKAVFFTDAHNILGNKIPYIERSFTRGQPPIIFRLKINDLPDEIIKTYQSTGEARFLTDRIPQEYLEYWDPAQGKWVDLTKWDKDIGKFYRVPKATPLPELTEAPTPTGRALGGGIGAMKGVGIAVIALVMLVLVAFGMRAYARRRNREMTPSEIATDLTKALKELRERQERLRKLR
ncbi:MAG: SpoIIE family protein phosphatase [Candidatus Woesearchaeota archaeon]